MPVHLTGDVVIARRQGLALRLQVGVLTTGDACAPFREVALGMAEITWQYSDGGVSQSADLLMNL